MVDKNVKAVYKLYPDGQESIYNVNREDFQECESIIYHEPQGVGDKHYCDVFFKDKDKRKLRIFEPDEIKF